MHGVGDYEMGKMIFSLTKRQANKERQTSKNNHAGLDKLFRSPGAPLHFYFSLFMYLFWTRGSERVE